MCHILTLLQPSPTPCRGNLIDVNILLHSQVLMSASCHILKSWCQHLVTFSSLDASIITIIVIVITALFSHMLSPEEPTYARGREVVGAVMNRKYLVHSSTVHNLTRPRELEVLNRKYLVHIWTAVVLQHLLEKINKPCYCCLSYNLQHPLAYVEPLEALSRYE